MPTPLTRLPASTLRRGTRVRITVVRAGIPPSDHELACDGIPASSLAAASTDGIRNGALLTVAGVGVPVLATLSALVVLIVLLVMRRRSTRRIQAATHDGGHPAA